MLAFWLSACSLDQGLDFSDIKVSKSDNIFLTEYHENKELAQTFEYEHDQLIYQTLYENNDVRRIQFVYSENGQVDSAYIRQRWFPRDLKFHYKDSLVMEWEVWNSNKLRQRVYLERDEQGRIIKLSRVSLQNGLVHTYSFTWEGQNYSRYEIAWYGEFEKLTYVYEFKYDQFKNPHYSAFHNIGFNFVDFLPLTENNAVEMLAYQKDNLEGTKITYKNKFLYVGKYPYIRESAWTQGENHADVYGVFRYNR